MNCQPARIITWVPQKMTCQYWIPFVEMICLMVQAMTKVSKVLLSPTHRFIKETHIFQA